MGRRAVARIQDTTKHRDRQCEGYFVATARSATEANGMIAKNVGKGLLNLEAERRGNELKIVFYSPACPTCRRIVDEEGIRRLLRNGRSRAVE